MILTLCRKVDLMRFFGSAVVAQPFGLAIDGHACSPFVLKPNDAHKTRFVTAIGFTHVLRITICKYIAKVCNSVVGFVAVNVVNKPLRPFTMHMQPRQPMRLVDALCYSNSDVANSFFCATSNIARLYRSARLNFPHKTTGTSVIMKHGSQLFRRQYHFKFPVMSMNVITLTTGVQT